MSSSNATSSPSSGTPASQKQYNVELLVCGNQAVGKTCLLFRFEDPNKEFQTSFISTIGIDYKYKKMKMYDEEAKKDVMCKCRIWDTAGQERYVPIATNRFRSMHGIMLVYDITEPKTFQAVETWIKRIKDNTNMESDFPIQMVLVGNKVDFQERRMVSVQQGQQLAQRYGMPFFETSAKTLVNVNTAFETLCRLSLPKVKHEEKKKNQQVIINVEEDNKRRSKGGCCSSYTSKSEA